MNKYILFPLCAAGLAFAGFAAVMGLVLCSVEPQIARAMVLLLPGAVYLFIAFLSYRQLIRDSTTLVLTVLLAIPLFIASFFYSIYLIMVQSTTETTDVRYYQRALDAIVTREGVNGMFPLSIPEDAKSVEFYYFPGFLQAGESFELSYIANVDELDEWSKRLREGAEWSGSGREYRDYTDWSISRDDYDLDFYLLYWDGGYNHGEQSRVTIDTDTGRITFSYSNW